MICKYTASEKHFCKIGSKRRLSGQNRQNYLNSMINNGIAPSELRKDAARQIMNSGMYGILLYSMHYIVCIYLNRKTNYMLLESITDKLNNVIFLNLFFFLIER